MALTNDYTARIRGLTIGTRESGYLWASSPTGTSGLPSLYTSDTPRGVVDGETSGEDVYTKRLITVSVVILGDGVNDSERARDAMAKLHDLKAAWAKAAGNVAFEWRLPGYDLLSTDGTLRFMGRPRELNDDLDHVDSGEIRVFGTFHALDPYAYAAPITVPLTAGSNTITVNGTATSRPVIKVVGNGSKPLVRNVTDTDETISFKNNIPSGTEVTINIADGTVVDNTGVNRIPDLSPGFGLPILLPGTNTLTVTGAASGSVTYQPAYL